MAGRIQKINGTDHIGIDKIERGNNGPVYMAFRGQVNYGIRLMCNKNPFKRHSIQDIRFFKKIIRCLLNIPQVFQVAGISECIQVRLDSCLQTTGLHATQ